MSEVDAPRTTAAAAYTPDIAASSVSPASEPAAAPRAPGAAVLGGLDVPRDTTPTFELEMLVSGAVLFGLVQLPDAIHAVTDQWQPHVGLIGLFGTAIVNVIVVAAIYGLILCFVAHLLLRGYWVALVGVHSVFPQGARPDRMKGYGPVQADVMRESIRPLGWHIARVDNVASLVFASGFLLAASSLSSTLFMLAVLVPALAAERVWGLRGVLWTLGAVLAPLALATVAAQIADHRMRDRGVDLRARGPRLIRALLAPAYRLAPGGVRSLNAVLASNIPRKVTMAALAVAMPASLGSAMLHAMDDGGMPGASNYRYFALGEPASVMAGRYASLRGDAPARSRAPSLDTDVATGPYVRLFIPYRAMLHNAAMAAGCPGVRPIASGDPDAPAGRAGADSALRCAERLHRVTLDGRPIQGLRFRFHEDPRTNRRGFLAYVATAELATGEHTVAVWPVHLPGDPPASFPYELPFWR